MGMIMEMRIIHSRRSWMTTTGMIMIYLIATTINLEVQIRKEPESKSSRVR